MSHYPTKFVTTAEPEFWQSDLLKVSIQDPSAWGNNEQNWVIMIHGTTDYWKHAMWFRHPDKDVCQRLFDRVNHLVTTVDLKSWGFTIV